MESPSAESESLGAPEGSLRPGRRRLGLRRRLRRAVPRPPPGAAAGLDAASPDVRTLPEPSQVEVRVFDYGLEICEERTFDAAEGVSLPPRPEGNTVRWVDVVGLHAHVVDGLSQQVGFHTLAAEDVVHVGQRPRLEAYEGYLYLPIQMMRMNGGGVLSEQVSLFIFPDLILTFQETAGDVWAPLRDRIRREGTRVRRHRADYLAYALLDAVVDRAFPVIEEFGIRLEALEGDILHRPRPDHLSEIQLVRRELGMLRRTFGPLRKTLEALLNNEVVPLKKVSRTFLRDVLGHADQLVDLVEAHWDSSGGITDLYMSVASHRMNQVMKVLTILSAIFIPLTFLAGVYGMNLSHLPGASTPDAFWIFSALCGFLAGGMLVLFWAWGWFQR